MLAKEVTAIQVVPTLGGRDRSGVIASLPCGATVNVCGSGFNQRTAKVRYRDSYFFVFLQDLEQPARYGA